MTDWLLGTLGATSVLILLVLLAREPALTIAEAPVEVGRDGNDAVENPERERPAYEGRADDPDRADMRESDRCGEDGAPVAAKRENSPHEQA